MFSLKARNMYLAKHYSNNDKLACGRSGSLLSLWLGAPSMISKQDLSFRMNLWSSDIWLRVHPDHWLCQRSREVHLDLKVVRGHGVYKRLKAPLWRLLVWLLILNCCDKTILAESPFGESWLLRCGWGFIRELCPAEGYCCDCWTP